MHDVYEHAKSYELTDEELRLLGQGKLGMTYERGDFDSNLDYYKYLAANWLSKGSEVLDAYAVPVIIISIVIGITLFLIARKSIGLRKVAVLFFIIGIPSIVYLMTYGMAILADAF